MRNRVVSLVVTFGLITASVQSLAADKTKKASLKKLVAKLERKIIKRQGGCHLGRGRSEAPMAHSGVYIYFNPFRYLRSCNIPKTEGCPFDHIVEKDMPKLSWRSYFLIANAMPYASSHLLLVPKEHTGQGSFHLGSHLKDIFDLHQKLPHKTMFFNHLAGNSQPHLHVHLAELKLPAAERLKGQVSPVQRYRFGKCMKGFSLKGSRQWVEDSLRVWIPILLEQGLKYNLVVFERKKSQEEHALLIVKRLFEGERAGLFHGHISSLEASGLGLVSRPVHHKALAHLAREPEFLDAEALDVERFDQELALMCDYEVVDPFSLKMPKLQKYEKKGRRDGEGRLP